jgi:hypothetical protein
MERRIDKLTKRLKAAEALVSQYEQSTTKERAKGTEAAPAAASSTIKSEFGSHPEIVALSKELTTVNEALEWLEANPDGGELQDSNGKPVLYEAADIRRMKRQMEGRRSEVLAERVGLTRYLKAEQGRQFEVFKKEATSNFEKATVVYPWLKNEESAEFQEAKALLDKLPYLAQHPDLGHVLGDYLAGKRVREAKLKAAVKPAGGAGNPAPTKLVTRGGSVAPRVEAGGGQSKIVKAAEDQFQKSGSVHDLARTLAAQESRPEGSVTLHPGSVSPDGGNGAGR